MIPLIFIAFALGVGLSAYELSSKARAWVDEHVQAVGAALAAHRAAEAHLAAAKAAAAVGDAVTAAQHLHAADSANREAAQQTATAAQTAKTDARRTTAADSAKVVVKREEKIAVALADIGVGQCDLRTYPGVSPQIRDALIARLHGEGMAVTVTGNNLWDIDTHNHNVKLRAAWDPQTQELKLIVTSGQGGYFGLVTCSAIWSEIDPIVKGIIGP